MSDQFNVVQQDGPYEVNISLRHTVREYVGVTDFRHSPKEASIPQTYETEVERMTFSHEDKRKAVQRAIDHLKIIGDFE